MLSALEEALCFHEALRTLGFEADELFLLLDIDSVFVAVRAQGKDFNIACGKSGFKTSEDAGHAWHRLLAWWRCDATTDFERNALYQKSSVARSSVGLLTALVSRGLRIPKAVDEVEGTSREMLN